MAGGNKNGKPRSLGEVVQELRGKTIKAAQKKQPKLAESAEQPLRRTVEQSAATNTDDGVDGQEDGVLAAPNAVHQPLRLLQAVPA